jgi:hypothetical protein
MSLSRISVRLELMAEVVVGSALSGFWNQIYLRWLVNAFSVASLYVWACLICYLKPVVLGKGPVRQNPQMFLGSSADILVVYLTISI